MPSGPQGGPGPEVRSEGLGGGEVVAERLLDDHPVPPRGRQARVPGPPGRRRPPKQRAVQSGNARVPWLEFKLERN